MKKKSIKNDSKATREAALQAGAELEKRISRYYEALGFRVSRNVRLGNHQVDLLASKYISGAGTMTIMVESKQRSTTLGINHIDEFVNRARRLIDDHHINCAVMVTDSQFSQDARGSVVGLSNIRLLTVDELEQDVFNNSEALLRVIHDYEHQDIFREYVALKGTDRQNSEHEVVEYIVKWSYCSEQLLLVLGDFGSGKTTVVERTHYVFARARMTNVDGLFPVLLRLKTLRHCRDLWHFIETSLRDNQYISISQSVFDAQLKSGRLLLLLDGFDEIQAGASAVERGQFLAQLAPLLSSRSPCVITTRPTYFESFAEMASAFNSAIGPPPELDRLSSKDLDVGALLAKLQLATPKQVSKQSLSNAIRIARLDKRQIFERLEKDRDRLEKMTKMSVGSFQEFLFGIYDIEDLMRRPLLLKMIIETVLSAHLDIGRGAMKLGPASLYDLYTQMCALRDIRKAPQNQYLTASERLTACHSIAVEMFKKKKLELTHGEVAEAIEAAALPTVINELRPARQQALDRALTDVRLCSFLQFEDDGSLSFAHKSYVEFFVAQHVFMILKSNPAEIGELSEWELSREIAYFLGSFVRDQEDFSAMLRTLVRGSLPPKVMSFVYRLAFAAGTLLERSKINGGDIHEIDLRRAEIGSTNISNLSLLSSTIRDVKAREWQVSGLRLQETLISRTEFTDCDLAISGRSYQLEEVTVGRGALTISGDGWVLAKTEVSNARLSVAGAGRMLSVRITEKSIATICAGTQLLVGSRLEISNSTVVGLGYERWYEDSTTTVLRNCVLVGLWIDMYDLLRKSRDAPAIEIHNCTGVVLLNSDHVAQHDAEYARELETRFPQITFVNATSIRGAVVAKVRHSRPGAMPGSSVARTSGSNGEQSDVVTLAANVSRLGLTYAFRKSYLATIVDLQN